MCCNFDLIYLGMVIFSPSSETQLGPFNEHMKYFLDRNRAGVVSLRKHALYLLPPSEKAFSFHKFRQSELLGIIVDTPSVIEGII